MLFILKAQQGGQIGLAVVGEFMEPYSDSPDDKAAAERYLDFLFGWSVSNLTHLHSCLTFQHLSLFG